MIATKLLRYETGFSLVRGLRQLRAEGVSGRGMLFLALDEHGEAHLAIADSASDRLKLKIGTKLALPPPFAGRVFYFDSVHPLGAHTAVVNGDRRIGKVANLVDVAEVVSGFVGRADGESVFFGCTPHQPGSWWVQNEQALPLHDQGFVEIVPSSAGLVARRIMEDGLYFLETDAAVAGGVRSWRRIYDSPLGNVLMLERRPKAGRLVLSCQRGLVELDLRHLPRVDPTTVAEVEGGYAVVGRITDGAFAVTRGVPRDWGFDELAPATLLGGRGGTLKELIKLLRKDPGL